VTGDEIVSPRGASIRNANKKGTKSGELHGVRWNLAMAGMGQFRRYGRMANWSGVAQQSEVRNALRHFRVAPSANVRRSARKYEPNLGLESAAR
jgi:hypothetical protein